MTRSIGPPGTTSRNVHLVRFEGVRLGSRRAPLLADLTITLHPGQFWCLLLAPGALRTVLVRTLLGAVRARAGTIEWNPSFASRRASATSRIGFVPDTFSLAGGVSTTVREFVSLGLVGIAPGGASEAHRIGWALEQVGLADVRGRDVPTLTSTERVSLLVARALARRPRLLVVEDPTSELDVEARYALLDVLAQLQRNERLTVAYVTTDIDVTDRYATHVALPSGGRLSIARNGDAEFLSILKAAGASAPMPPSEDTSAKSASDPLPSDASSGALDASAHGQGG